MSERWLATMDGKLKMSDNSSAGWSFTGVGSSAKFEHHSFKLYSTTRSNSHTPAKPKTLESKAAEVDGPSYP